MAGSFSSINTALTALRYQQIALDVASTNVANVGTDGYVRRRVVGETLGAGHTTALWSRSTTPSSGGVQASRLDRMVDPLLDARVRREHGRQSYLDLKAEALARVETGLAEPGDSGVAAALADFRSSLHDLGNAPGSDAARSQVLSAAATVADAVRLQAHHLADEASDQRAHTLSAVDEVNTVTTQLAATNKTIAAAHTGGTDTTDLLDERDALALRLAELTGATSTIRADGGMDVDLNGLSLVSGSSSAQLQIAGGVAADGSAAPGALTFALLPSGGGPAVAVSGALGGDLGATAELLNDALPTYAAGLALVAKNLADSVNTQHALGFDRSGTPGGPLFSYDPTDAAGSLDVVITDPSKLAASSVASASLDAGNAGPLADAVNVDDQYQRLVNTFGSTVASAQRLAKNQGAMTAQVDSAREQLVGVSLDEETVNMLAAQRAYESAARVMTTVDSVLDTLINRTGLVR